MALYDYFLIHPFGSGPRTLVVIYVGLTGGGQLNLDGEPTIGSPTDGTVCRFFIDTNATASLWQLISSNHIDDPTNGWKRPLDYADGQNQKVWKRLVCFGTGGGGGAVSSVFGRTGDVVAAANDYTFAQIGSKPTTLAGYGITDAVAKQPAYPTPGTINDIITLLQTVGLCA